MGADVSGSGSKQPGELPPREQRLRFLEETQEIAGIGSWFLDRRTGRMDWSPQLHRILQTDPATFVPTVADLWASAHPDDTAGMAAEFARIFSGESDALRMEHRILRSDGEVRTVEMRARPDLEADGEIATLVGYIRDVTESRRVRRELAAALAETAEQSRLLAEAQRIAGVGSWTLDLTTGVVAWSEELQRIFGVTAETTARTVEEYIAHVHPGDQARAADVAAHSIGSGEPFVIDHRLVREDDGEVRTIRILGNTETDAQGNVLRLYGTGEDITDALAVQRQLTEARDQFTQLLGAATGQAIIGSSPDNVVTLFNRGAERILGYSAEEIIGGSWTVYHDPEEVRAFVEAHARGEYVDLEGRPIASGADVITETDEREWTWVRKDGTRLVVSISTTPMRNHEGEITGFVGIASDVTERRKAEDDSRRAVEAMADARDRALKANAAKSAFLATMSHEIRTPMNAVLGLSMLLLDTPLDDEQRDLMTTLRSSGDQLLAIINDILDFSKVEAGELDLEQSPFDLRELLQGVMASFAASGSASGLTLTSQVAAEVPAVVVGDAVRVRQVLSNLIGNAVKFTHEGGVQVLAGITSDPVGDGRQSLRFDVTDTGIGIPEEAMDRLFRSFSQVDASTTRVYGGTGLGLAICRGLTEAMGGRLWVESTPDVGSTFSFTIDVGEVRPVAPLAVPAPRAEQPAPADPPGGAGLRILLAEDNAVNQKVGRLMLAKLGHDVDVAENGREALEAVVGGGYDVVLMDVHMPDMDGLEATRRIRAEVAPDRQPYIIAATASVTQEDRDACAAAGMNDYVPKPIRITELAAALATARTNAS